MVGKYTAGDRVRLTPVETLGQWITGTVENGDSASFFGGVSVMWDDGVRSTERVTRLAPEFSLMDY